MLALLLLLQAPAQAPARLTGFLTQSIGLDAAQLAALERGEPVVKVLETHDRRDVAIFGVITASKSPAQFAAAARDFPAALHTPNRTGVGIFSTPAAPGDVAAVTIDERDVADMKNCKPGDCVVKLPATDMRRIHDEINWSAPDVQAQLSNYARRRLVGYVGDHPAPAGPAVAPCMRAKRSRRSSPSRRTSTRTCRRSSSIWDRIRAARCPARATCCSGPSTRCRTCGRFSASRTSSCTLRRSCRASRSSPPSRSTPTIISRRRST